jgi:molybdopterin-guanine dinucleotide biosynthesis protein B
MLVNARVPVLGFAAYSGTGKTTLLVRLLPLLKARGLRVALVKHAHHKFDIDHPGKDSYELRKAGANPMLIGSKNQWALMVETSGQKEPILDDLLGYLDQSNLDLVLVEGFKHVEFPKIELHRPSLGKPLLYREDASIIAIATDSALEDTSSVPRLDLNAPEEIVAFIIDRVIL